MPNKSVHRLPRESPVPSQIGLAADHLGELLIDSGIQALLDSKLPVDLEEIARAVGIKSIHAASIPGAGMLVPLDGKALILVNKSHPKERQRFSCAHEIAHAMIDPEVGPALRRRSTASKNELEKTCERLASLLVMPNPAFRDLAVAKKPSIAAVEYLCRIFATSVQATAIRFITEINEACVLIVSDKFAGSNSSQPTVRWANHNIPKPERGAKLFIRPGTPLSIRTAMAASYKSGVQRGWDVIQLGDQHCRSYVESKSFGQGDREYVLSLVFPERTLARHLIEARGN